VQSFDIKTLTGQALVDALIARDDRIWQVFLHDLGRMLQGICRKDDLTDDEIDDVAQAVVEKMLDHDCKALRSLSIRDNNQFYGWMRIVISRTALDQVRKHRLRQGKEYECAKKQARDSSVTSTEADRIELRVILENAASELSPIEQTLFWLKYREASDGEMAKITGLPLTTVVKRVSRLKQKLREKLKDIDKILRV
jgi:RNA polymerase sigma factor (sigma-70 family)